MALCSNCFPRQVFPYRRLEIVSKLRLVVYSLVLYPAAQKTSLSLATAGLWVGIQALPCIIKSITWPALTTDINSPGPLGESSPRLS